MRATTWLPLLVLPAVAAVLALPRPARAAPSCSIANVTPMSFGTYHSGSSFPLDSTGEIDVTCAGPTAVQISMGRGTSGHQSPRHMTSNGDRLDYNLYLDAARTTVWGDGTEGTQLFSGMVAMGQTLRLPIFGRVFPLQSVPRGSYVDRIVVFVVF